MASALIALGGNVDDVRATFREAIPVLCSRAEAVLVARSSDFVTPPWGDLDQPPFINACIEIETPLDPQALLTVLKDVERSYGRTRDKDRRWGPRTLDLDLIAYDDVTLQGEDLTLPHPRLFQRAFVLVPLADIAPDRLIRGVRIRDALVGLSTQGITRLPDNP